MTRVGGLFDPLTGFGALLVAFKKAFQGSGRTEEACAFYFNLERGLLTLQAELRNGTYRPAPYRYFRIFDPKERTISVAPFRDRVVHHAVVGALEPVYERCFIHDSYATRKGKGTHRALLRAQLFLRRNAWYLKTDVEKYFDNIDHRLLQQIIARKIKDRRVLALLALIIANSDTSRGLAAGKGLPIGNLTSQFLANVYLDPLDHYLKETCGLRAYIRYMDDLVVFGPARDPLRAVLENMRTFLQQKLALQLQQRATFLQPRQHGLPFLGFRVFPRLMRIKPANLRRLKQRLRARDWEYRRGRISEEKFVASMQSTFSHAAWGNTLQLRRALLAGTGLGKVMEV